MTAQGVAMQGLGRLGVSCHHMGAGPALVWTSTTPPAPGPSYPRQTSFRSNPAMTLQRSPWNNGKASACPDDRTMLDAAEERA